MTESWSGLPARMLWSQRNTQAAPRMMILLVPLSCSCFPVALPSQVPHCSQAASNHNNNSDSKYLWRYRQVHAGIFTTRICCCSSGLHKIVFTSFCRHCKLHCHHLHPACLPRRPLQREFLAAPLRPPRPSTCLSRKSRRPGRCRPFWSPSLSSLSGTLSSPRRPGTSRPRL